MSLSRAGGTGRPARFWLKSFLSCLILIMALAVVASTIGMVIACWSALPLADQWGEIISGREITWSWLISQHNEHRILFPRLIFLLDYLLASENNSVDLTVNLLIQAGLTAVLVRVARGAEPWNGMRLVWTTGLILASLFWAAQWENFTWGLQVQFFGVMLAATSTFAILGLRRPTAGSLAAVICMEAISVYTFSSGAMVPFLALALAVWLRQSRPRLIVLAISAVSLFGAFLFHYTKPTGLSNASDLPTYIPDVIHYMAVELGGPLASALAFEPESRLVPIATVLGGIGLTLALVLGWRYRQRPSPSEKILLTLGGFMLTMILLTGMGRAFLGMEQALSVRYATPAILLWLSMILLIASRHRTGGLLLAVPFVLFIGLSQGGFVHRAKLVATSRAMAAPALLANVGDILDFSDSIPFPGFALSSRHNLQSHHTSVFADAWADWNGTPLTDHVTLVDATRCEGHFEAAKPVRDPDYPGWRAFGWFKPSEHDHSRPRLLITDAAGKIVGYGLGDFSAFQVGAAPKKNDPDVTFWLGAFTGDKAVGTTAFLLLDDRTACSFGTPMRVETVDFAIVADHPADLTVEGQIDAVSLDPTTVVVDGWGLFHNDGDAARLMLDTNLPVKSFQMISTPRADVAAVTADSGLAEAGFHFVLDLDAPLPPVVKLCLWSDDPVYGRHIIKNPIRPDLCPS